MRANFFTGYVIDHGESEHQKKFEFGDGHFFKNEKNMVYTRIFCQNWNLKKVSLFIFDVDHNSEEIF